MYKCSIPNCSNKTLLEVVIEIRAHIEETVVSSEPRKMFLCREHISDFKLEADFSLVDKEKVKPGFAGFGKLPPIKQY